MCIYNEGDCGVKHVCDTCKHNMSEKETAELGAANHCRLRFQNPDFSCRVGYKHCRWESK